MDSMKPKNMSIYNYFHELVPQLFEFDENVIFSMYFTITLLDYHKKLHGILLDHASKLCLLHETISKKEHIDDDDKLYQDYTEELVLNFTIIDEVTKIGEVDTHNSLLIFGGFHMLLDKLCALPEKYLLIDEVRESIKCVALFADPMLTRINQAIKVLSDKN